MYTTSTLNLKPTIEWDLGTYERKIVGMTNYYWCGWDEQIRPMSIIRVQSDENGRLWAVDQTGATFKLVCEKGNDGFAPGKEIRLVYRPVPSRWYQWAGFDSPVLVTRLPRKLFHVGLGRHTHTFSYIRQGLLRDYNPGSKVLEFCNQPNIKGDLKQIAADGFGVLNNYFSFFQGNICFLTTKIGMVKKDMLFFDNRTMAQEFARCFGEDLWKISSL